MSDESNEAAGRGEVSIDVTIGAARFAGNGEGVLVLEAFSAFREFYTELGATPEPFTGRADQSSGIEEQFNDMPETDEEDRSGAGEDTVRERVPLPVFIAGKQLPRGNHYIALAITVWAKRYNSETEFDADTARGHWRASGKKLPANVNRDLGTAASNGWFERLAGGSGRYSVTSYGERVFDELPISSS